MAIITMLWCGNHCNLWLWASLQQKTTIKPLLLLLLLLHYTCLMASFPGQHGLPYQKGKTSWDLNEARDDGVLGSSGISWIICKQSAPCSRHITTPAPHHSIFTGRMLFLMPN